MRDVLLDGGGYSELQDGASDRVAAKSSYDAMSDKPPVVDMVNEEPDMRLELYTLSIFRGSLSTPVPLYLRSIIGTHSSVACAWPGFISESMCCKSMASPHILLPHASVSCEYPWLKYIDEGLLLLVSDG